MSSDVSFVVTGAYRNNALKKAVGTLRPDGQTLKNQMKTIFLYWVHSAESERNMFDLPTGIVLR